MVTMTCTDVHGAIYMWKWCQLWCAYKGSSEVVVKRSCWLCVSHPSASPLPDNDQSASNSPLQRHRNQNWSGQARCLWRASLVLGAEKSTWYTLMHFRLIKSGVRTFMTFTLFRGVFSDKIYLRSLMPRPTLSREKGSGDHWAIPWLCWVSRLDTEQPNEIGLRHATMCSTDLFVVSCPDPTLTSVMLLKSHD